MRMQNITIYEPVPEKFYIIQFRAVWKVQRVEGEQWSVQRDSRDAVLYNGFELAMQAAVTEATWIAFARMSGDGFKVLS